MCKIMMPIKPKYVKGILSGHKTYELRRKIPKKIVNEILIYETSPVSKITGKIKISTTHKLKKRDLWELTKSFNMLTKLEFFEYFGKNKYGFAFEIDKVKKYKRPKDIKEFGLKHPPQGFVYINF